MHWREDCRTPSIALGVFVDQSPIPQKSNNNNTNQSTMDDIIRNSEDYPEDTSLPPTQEIQDGNGPNVATPEQQQLNNQEAAAAAAEVAAQRERPEDQVAEYEATDESGELVRQAFLQFLQE